MMSRKKCTSTTFRIKSYGGDRGKIVIIGFSQQFSNPKFEQIFVYRVGHEKMLMEWGSERGNIQEYCT